MTGERDSGTKQPDPGDLYRAGTKNRNNIYRHAEGDDPNGTHVGVTFNGLDGHEVVAALNAWHRPGEA